MKPELWDRFIAAVMAEKIEGLFVEASLAANYSLMVEPAKCLVNEYEGRWNKIAQGDTLKSVTISES